MCIRTRVNSCKCIFFRVLSCWTSTCEHSAIKLRKCGSKTFVLHHSKNGPIFCFLFNTPMKLADSILASKLLPMCIPSAWRTRKLYFVISVSLKPLHVSTWGTKWPDATATSHRFTVSPLHFRSSLLTQTTVLFLLGNLRTIIFRRVFFICTISKKGRSKVEGRYMMQSDWFHALPRK